MKGVYLLQKNLHMEIHLIYNRVAHVDVREGGPELNFSQVQLPSQTPGISIALRTQGSKDTRMEASTLPWIPQDRFQYIKI